jgi:hypothetical protein
MLGPSIPISISHLPARFMEVNYTRKPMCARAKSLVGRGCRDLPVGDLGMSPNLSLL